MSEPELIVRIARPADHATLVSILSEAAEWMKSRGLTQWEAILTDRHKLDRGVTMWIERGEARIGELHGRSAGMFVLGRGGKWEMEVWGEPDPAATYLSKLAIRREFAGRQLGLRLLRRAESLASADGSTVMRLDAAADNPALLDWYDRAGYRQCGELTAHGFQLQRFQKDLVRTA